MLINFNHLKTFYNALIQKMKGFRGNWEQNDPVADDYIKNRPFYEESIVVNEPLNITWDGNTDGLMSVEIYGMLLYKISDIALTNEQLRNACLGFSDGEEWNTEEDWDWLSEESTEDVFNFDLCVVVVRKAGATFQGYTFPDVGIYFAHRGDDSFVSSFTTAESIEHTKTTIHKLDSKYLPDNIGVPDGIVTEDSLPVILENNLAPVAFTNSYNSLSSKPTIYTDVVRYTSQTLTDNQKTISRTNIGAASATDIEKLQKIHQHDGIVLTDISNGCKYLIQMKDGNLISRISIEHTLIDFNYTDNGDGTYTITSWKGTYNEEPSTEIIIPNLDCIIV